MRRLLPWLRGGLRSAAWALVFVAAVATGVVLHLDIPPARRLLAALAQTQLTKLLVGAVRIQSVRQASLSGFEVSAGSVLDQHGAVVLEVKDLRVRWDTIPFLRGLLQDDMKVLISTCSVSALSLALRDEAESATPTLVSALSRATPPTAPSAGGVRVKLEGVRIGQAQIDGGPFGAHGLKATLGEFQGSFELSPQGVILRSRPLSLRIDGLLPVPVSGDLSLSVDTGGSSRAAFAGSVGSVRLAAQGALHADAQQPFFASVDVWNASPAAVEQIWAAWPFRSSLELHAELQGTLEGANLVGALNLGEGRAYLGGKLNADRALGVALELEAAGLQLASLMPNAPEGRVSLSARLKAWFHANQWILDVNGTTAATQLAGVPVPAVDFQTSVEAPRVTGRLKLHEPGMPLRVEFESKPDALSFSAKLPPFNLQDADRLTPVVALQGSANAELKGEIKSGKLSMNASGAARNVRIARDLSFPDAQARVTITGPLDPKRWRVAADLTGSELTAMQSRFSALKVAARGDFMAPTVEVQADGPLKTRLFARAQVPLATPSRFQALHAGVEYRGHRVGASAASLDLSSGQLALRDFVVTGLGKPISGSLEVESGRTRLKVASEGIDLAAVSRLAGAAKPIEGRLALKGDLRVDGATPRGDLRLQLEDGQIGTLKSVAALVEMHTRGDDLLLSASADAARLGSGAMTLTVPRQRVLDPTTWSELTGQAQLTVAQLELAEALAAAGITQDVGVTGRATGNARLSRLDAAAEPELELSASTTGLRLQTASASGREVLEGLDLAAAVQVRQGRANARVRITDALGTALTAQAFVPFGRGDVASSWSAIQQRLKNRRLAGHVILEPRQIAALPSRLRPAGLSGQIRGQALLGGTIAAPSARVVAAGAGLRYTSDQRVPAADVYLDARVDSAAGLLAGHLDVANRGKRLARAALDVRAPIVDFVRGTPEARRALRGTSSLEFSGLPLQMFLPHSTAKMRGALYGAVEVEREARRPRVHADLRLRNAGVDDTVVDEVRLVATSNAEDVHLALTGKQREGRLRVGLDGRLSWDHGIPRLHQAAPLRAELSAHKLRAALLEPVLGDLVSELDGMVNASVRASLRYDTGSKRWRSQLDGTAQLTEGKLQIAMLGDRLEQIRATARLGGRDGHASLTVRDLSGTAGAGKTLRGNAVVRFDRRGLREGTGQVRLQSFPVTLDGVTLAQASGSADVVLRREAGYYDLRVTADRVLTELTESVADQVQPLDAHPSVVIAQFEPKVASKTESVPWRIRLNATRIRVLRQGIDILVSGRPTLTLGAAPAQLTGSIDLVPGGRVPLIGKLFIIESGRVVFDTGDVKNPHLSLTAKWTAQDGTVIFIDLSGTLKKAHLTLRSDPGLPQSEILARLLGGSGDVALASALALQGVTQMLENTPLEGLQLRAKSDNARTGAAAAVRLAEGLWLEGSYTQETESQEIGPQEQFDALTGTLDWRFSPRWSLRTELGNAGSAAVDLVWRFRY